MEKPCPDEELIADYFKGRLSDKETDVMEKHLSNCSQCLMDFQVIFTLSSDLNANELDDVPERVTQAVIDLVNNQNVAPSLSRRNRLRQLLDGIHSKVYDSFIWPSWGQWRLAPIRGSRTVLSEDITQIKKVFREVNTEIEFEKVSGNKTNIRVKLLKDSRTKPGIRVTLKRDEREILSHLIDTQSDVLFEGVSFGKYQIIFTRDGLKLGIYHFEIKEPANG